MTDLLTKALAIDKFQKFRANMIGEESKCAVAFPKINEEIMQRGGVTVSK